MWNTSKEKKSAFFKVALFSVVYIVESNFNAAPKKGNEYSQRLKWIHQVEEPLNWL